MANQNTEEMEELAVELMVTQQLKPLDALEKVGLNYEPKSTGYNRVFGKKRRRIRALRSRKLCTENNKLRTHQKNKAKKEESLQQYRHERNMATRKLDEAFAEIRALQKLNKALLKEAETCKKR